MTVVPRSYFFCSASNCFCARSRFTMARRTLALPFHTRLDPDDQERVVETLADVLGAR